MINAILIIAGIAALIIRAVPSHTKGVAAVAAVALNSLISGYIAVLALAGHDYSVTFEGSLHLGQVPVVVDALSAWFIVTINFTMLTGAVYGMGYMKQYQERKPALTLHWIAFVFLHTALLAITSVQNSMVFMLFWEIMALSAFILIIFEYQKSDTLQAGINYIIQSHISLAILMLGFMFAAFKTGSYEFSSLIVFSQKTPALVGTALFLVFFTGFAIKAGFVPFHTWLPYAHPVAPSHVSGVLSGVVIKIGIFGILRMLLLLRVDYSSVGYIILFMSLVSGLYGVMLAIVQHNLKKLLAYHSIENIGIIGIGIGIGCIGVGAGNRLMAVLGFSGALLHTLNHSLFKSLLFYSAGNVYQMVHSVSVEKLGGLIKKMPHTAFLFLLSALAICGIPPLNGFISEFLIYSGLYRGMTGLGLLPLMTVSFTLLGLALIGGLALLCFTKAFGIVFLGNMRHECQHTVAETGKLQLIPMYSAAAMIVFIGLSPLTFLHILQRPVALFVRNFSTGHAAVMSGIAGPLHAITIAAFIFVSVALLIAFLRYRVNKYHLQGTAGTWGCGYTGPAEKMQYTAGSFVRTYTKLAKPVLDISKTGEETMDIFPQPQHFESEAYDKIERIFIDKPLLLLNRITEWFTFLQNGRLQFYILYGIVFIVSVIFIPLFAGKLMALLHFLNNL
jgi:formate hydrogenlyase subunit 3/multisubunit Na+/H+ antiporter MnhD subunit